ncbi:hypothetical protein [Staphylococcus edaphicus]|uniref:Uncharacterized protein n=1 Tax=Staphylococcus edaphicus TaxID=1955013 RepID=A0A2C6WDZ6_9STAP|nr:hypothetical protein [Staphylococcus edaphicus]PHK49048.1 hypothetical protein BTJ66_10515 [Staphylococcus edaphicus]UQW81374.1 hypothetical protein MNY58_12565 [Staphylococcus edaphicus]
MAKYFTSIKVVLYLLAIIIIQPIVFNALDLNRAIILEIAGHSIFIIIGLIFIRLSFYFDKRDNRN